MFAVLALGLATGVIATATTAFAQEDKISAESSEIERLQRALGSVYRKVGRYQKEVQAGRSKIIQLESRINKLEAVKGGTGFDLAHMLVSERTIWEGRVLCKEERASSVFLRIVSEKIDSTTTVEAWLRKDLHADGLRVGQATVIEGLVYDFDYDDAVYRSGGDHRLCKASFSVRLADCILTAK